MYYEKQFERILKGSYLKVEKLYKLKSKAESKEKEIEIENKIKNQIDLSIFLTRKLMET